MILESADVRLIIQDVVKGVDISNLEDDQDFDEVGIDSLDHSLILLSVEEKSEIKIPDELVESCRSVNGIVSYLRDKHN